MKCSNLKIFFVHTNFQYMFVNKILEFYHFKNYLIYLESNVINTNSIDNKNIKYIGSGGGLNNSKKIFSSIRNEIEEFIHQHEQINFFISDTYWNLNNLIVANFKQHNNVNISIYADGIGFYLDSTFTLKTNIKNYIKKLYFTLQNIHYDVYFGNIMGTQRKEINTLYSFSNLLQLKTNKKLICIDAFKRQKDIEFTEEHALIIGQPYEKYIGNEKYIEIIKNMINYLKNNNVKTIYYKPHFFENNKIIDFLRQENVIYIDNKLTVEEMYNDYKTEYLISINSTALITLKLMYPDIKVIAFGNEEIKNMYFNFSLSSIVDLFKTIKINTLKIS